MKDVTEKMYAYRECVRNIWNNYLRPAAKPYVDFDAVDVFRGVCERLFDEIVLQSAGAPQFRKTHRRDPYPFLHVKPTSDPFPIMINRTTDSGYWDNPVSRLGLSGQTLLFIDYFDWDDFGYIDLQYYHVKIASCDEHPDLVGREALLEVHHAGVEFSEPKPE